MSQGDTLTRFRLADERKLVFLLNQRALYKAEVDSLLLLDSLNTVQKSMCDSTVLLSLRRSSLLQKEANLQMQRSNMWEAEASRQKKKRVVFQAISAILAVTIVAIEIF